MGLSGVGLAANWLRGLDLNQRPLGYESEDLSIFNKLDGTVGPSEHRSIKSRTHALDERVGLLAAVEPRATCPERRASSIGRRNTCLQFTGRGLEV